MNSRAKRDPVFILDPILELVDEQADDEGLWFVAQRAGEAYLQQELRRLHATIENAAAEAGAPSTQKVGVGG